MSVQSRMSLVFEDLYVILLLPIGEELFFRAALITLLRNRFSNRSFVVALSALLFAWPHSDQGYRGVLTAACVGAFFCCRYIRSSDNILETIVIHVLHNLCVQLGRDDTGTSDGVWILPLIIYGSCIFLDVVF
mmetsp:Transcript_28066/g.59635  ORF Transcript_28066/g.59635 Transcript_28066/m.59635 type:complete len:133 (+) Transcript_28066:55-453(+)